VEGFAWAEFEARTGLDRAVLAAELEQGAVVGELIELDAYGARATARGLDCLNEVLTRFLPS
jgi:hypothetical protein